MSTQQLIVLVILVVIVALSNERITELLKKLGVIKDGYAAVWQTAIGSVAFAAVAIAQHLGIENQLTDSVDALVQFATAAALLLPIFTQSVIAKGIHAVWQKVGFSYSLSLSKPKYLSNIHNSQVEPDRG